MRTNKKTWWIPYLFILPFLVSFVIFFLVPSVYSLVLSFTKYAGYGEAKWIGLKNYQTIFRYKRFFQAVERTAFYWLLKLVPVTIISFVSACLIHSRIVGRLAKFYKPILFLPQVCAVTATALMFQVVFSGGEGSAINQIFGTNINFIEDKTWAKWVVLIMTAWRSIGWFMVIYLSGLTSISPELNDAAKIDGASSTQVMFRITIPLMKSTFLFAFIMDAISSLRIYTEPAVLTGSGSGVARDFAEGVLNLMMVNMNAGNFGMACAYGWVIFAIIFIISMFFLRVLREDAD